MAEEKMENNSKISVVLKVGKLLPESDRNVDLKVYKNDDGVFVHKSVLEEALKPLNNFVDSAMMGFGYGPRIDGYKVVPFDKEWSRLEENIQNKSWVDGIVG